MQCNMRVLIIIFPALYIFTYYWIVHILNHSARFIFLCRLFERKENPVNQKIYLGGPKLYLWETLHAKTIIPHQSHSILSHRSDL